MGKTNKTNSDKTNIDSRHKLITVIAPDTCNEKHQRNNDKSLRSYDKSN